MNEFEVKILVNKMTAIDNAIHVIEKLLCEHKLNGEPVVLCLAYLREQSAALEHDYQLWLNDTLEEADALSASFAEIK